MINAGKYNHRININQIIETKDSDGFPVKTTKLVLTTMASVKTTRGMTLIKSGTDFEKAYTNFTIRYPHTLIDRDMVIEFHGKTYSIEYLNNVDESGIELEIQAREITH